MINSLTRKYNFLFRYLNINIKSDVGLFKCVSLFKNLYEECNNLSIFNFFNQNQPN